MENPQTGNLGQKGGVFVRVSIAVMKPHDRKQIGEERVNLAYNSTS